MPSVGWYGNIYSSYCICIGRTQGLRTQRTTVAGHDNLADAVRKLVSLTPAERNVLSDRTAQLWQQMLGQKAAVDTTSISWQDLFNNAIKTVQSGKICSTNSRLNFVLSENFLRTQTPFLQTARGFKTRFSLKFKLSCSLLLLEIPHQTPNLLSNQVEPRM